MTAKSDVFRYLWPFYSYNLTSVRSIITAIDSRDIVPMPRRGIELIKARNQKLDARLIRRHQAFRALNRMDETMRTMRSSFDLNKLINDLPVFALHACDSMILFDKVRNFE